MNDVLTSVVMSYFGLNDADMSAAVSCCCLHVHIMQTWADAPNVLQIIDRLCASVHYRQAVSCENSGASMASSPSSDCLLRITMSHHKVVHLPASPQQAAASAAAGQCPSGLLLLLSQKEIKV